MRRKGRSQQLVLRSVLLILPPHLVSTRTGAAKTRRQPERDHTDPRAMVGNGGSCGLVCPPPTCVLSLDAPFLPIRGFGEWGEEEAGSLQRFVGVCVCVCVWANVYLCAGVGVSLGA